MDQSFVEKFGYASLQIVRDEYIPIVEKHLNEKYGIELGKYELEGLLNPGKVRSLPNGKVSRTKKKIPTNSNYKCTYEYPKRKDNPARLCNKACGIHENISGDRKILKYCPNCAKKAIVIKREGWGSSGEDCPLINSNIDVNPSCYWDEEEEVEGEIIQEYPPPHPDEDPEEDTIMTFIAIEGSDYGYIKYKGLNPILKINGEDYEISSYILEDESDSGTMRPMTDDEIKIMAELGCETFDDEPILI